MAEDSCSESGPPRHGSVLHGPMIVILCGPPAVGKTTVAHLLRDRLRERGLSFSVLDSDQFSSNTYGQMFDRVDDSRKNWLLAGTFYKRTWQRRFERLDGVVVVYLRADLGTCLDRNRNRGAPIEETAVHIVWREFADPDADITLDVVDDSPAEVTDRLMRALDVPTDDRPS